MTPAPRQPTFQQAMEITAQWLELWEHGELSDEVLADRVAELVASRDGARGFFVVSLAGDCPLMDRLPETLLLQLRLAGEGVVDLSARNLAMSTAMALHHQRAGDSSQQGASSGCKPAAPNCCGALSLRPLRSGWKSCWRLPPGREKTSPS